MCRERDLTARKLVEQQNGKVKIARIVIVNVKSKQVRER